MRYAPRCAAPAAVAGALAFVLAVMAPAARADAGWFESGDTVLRADLQLLNDAEVIRLPVSYWPIPREAVRYALQKGRAHLATNAAVAAALARVRIRLDEVDKRLAGHNLHTDATVTLGSPGLWRDFDTLGREDAELGGAMRYGNDRFDVSLNVSGVSDPDDDEPVRLDGSQATVQLGNWLLSAHELDRFWGPSHQSSLILSNNARPMPTLMLERASAQPWETRWLNWLGPWRMSFGLSRMEGEREDIDAPLFMAWRFVVMPFKDIEVGFSRTAQFCGEELPCDLSSFWNMLIGNDNIGFDTTEETEPGNQMAGFDLRWASPIGNWPYAIYGQYIGEDESSYVPAKYLAQVGLEVWKPLSDGGMLQMFAEYSTTTCSANTSQGPYYNCAYNQGLFDVEGYRYLGRTIGYTSDRDAENYSIGASYTEGNGTLWTGTARTSRLNRDDYGDVRNTVASVPTDYDSIELGWRGKLWGVKLAVDLGVESIAPEQAERDINVYGFVSWRHEFSRQ